MSAALSPVAFRRADPVLPPRPELGQTARWIDLASDWRTHDRADNEMLLRTARRADRR